MNTLLLDRSVIASKPNIVMVERDCHSISKCSFCNYYQMETGSFGQCQMLNAPVQGAWKPCSLAKPVFTPDWE